MPNPPIILPDVAHGLRVRFLGTNQTRPWVNVLHMSFTGSSMAAADLAAVATALSGMWNTRIAPNVCNGMTLTSTEVLDISSRVGAVAVNSTSHVGTIATANYLPVNTACCVSWKIARRYRGGHPRMYLAGQGNQHVTNGFTWTAGYISALGTAMIGLIADVQGLTGTGSPFALINVSYFQRHQGYPNDVRPVPQVDTILSAVVHTRVDSMRRRLGKEVS